MSDIRPNLDQFQELATSLKEGTVVMLNLLKFKRHAASNGGSGASAYRRYGDAAVRMIEKQGGRLLWAGTADQVLIGELPPARPHCPLELVEHRSARHQKARRERLGEALIRSVAYARFGTDIDTGVRPVVSP